MAAYRLVVVVSVVAILSVVWTLHELVTHGWASLRRNEDTRGASGTIPPLALARVFPPDVAGLKDRQSATFSPRLRVTSQKWNAAGGGSLRHPNP